MSVRRFSASAVAAGALILTLAGTASAHECIISSRSAQGNLQAGAHAKVWQYLPLEVVFTQFLPSETGQPALNADQLAWAMEQSAAAGIPAVFTIRTDKTIGEGSNNPNLANGKGLDHAVDLYGDALGGIYFAALGH
jgi:hypothetical protein